MKRIAFILVAALALTSLPMTAQNMKRGQQQRRGGMQSMYTPEQQAERVAKDLNLSDAEKAKLVDFYTKNRAEREAARAEHLKNNEQRRAENMAKREEFRKEREVFQKQHDAELEKIIGKEKLEELKKMREERRNSNRSDAPRMGRNYRR